MDIKRFIEGPVMTNMYVVSDKDKNGFIVDAAFPSQQAIDYIKNQGIKIKFIIQTHTHFDHVLGLSYLKNLYQVDVYASEDSREIANDKEYNLAFGYDIDVPIDKYLRDGQVFSDFKIMAIKTPGHTLDSMSYKINDIIFSGDTLFNMSIGRSDLKGGDYGQIIDSIKNKLGLFDKDSKILSGHGEATKLGFELANNPFLV
ncbi:MAG: MBL fold metallo-hydrolase [Anaerococcus sp.]|nr:MBL fold metallo-hydrolase [Anaerococcus sp.]